MADVSARIRRPRPLDVWCPACGAEPWEKCRPYEPPNDPGVVHVPVNGRAHPRRRYLAGALARELGFAAVRQPKQLREAMR